MAFVELSIHRCNVLRQEVEHKSVTKTRTKNKEEVKPGVNKGI